MAWPKGVSRIKTPAIKITGESGVTVIEEDFITTDKAPRLRFIDGTPEARSLYTIDELHIWRPKNADSNKKKCCVVGCAEAPPYSVEWYYWVNGHNGKHTESKCDHYCKNHLPIEARRFMLGV